MRQSQRKHIYAAHWIIHMGTERALADLAAHQQASATKRKEDSPAGTASTALSGTAAEPSAADSTQPATINLDKASTRIPQPPRTEDEWGKFPCPSVILVLSMAREREAHYIYFSRAPWMENPLSSLGCPSCWLWAVLSWTILYTFWCGSFLHSLPSLLWPSLANFSLLII